jgi:cytochrome c2
MKRLAAVALLVLAACHRREERGNVNGDWRRGRELMTRYGCGACHVIPGVGIQGQVGPPLNRMAARAYIAGRLPNTPQDMIQWIRFPRSVDPGTAMPDLGVNDRDARDMAAYLYTLR